MTLSGIVIVIVAIHLISAELPVDLVKQRSFWLPRFFVKKIGIFNFSAKNLVFLQIMGYFLVKKNRFFKKKSAFLTETVVFSEKG